MVSRRVSSRMGGDGMKFNEMTIEQLKAYRASVEAYGTASELYEVEERIRELEGGNKDE